MRRKLKLGILLFLLSIMFTIPAYAAETDAWLDGWDYEISGSNVILKAYNGEQTELDIYGRAVVDGTSYIVLINYDSSSKASALSGNTDISAIFFHGISGQKVTGTTDVYMDGFFRGMTALEKISFSDRFDMSSIQDARYMFSGDTSLTTIDVENLDLSRCGTADRHSIPHKFIELEITESAAEDDPVELSRLIYKLRMQGFRVAIDDFGIGRSNFRFLIDNPVDVLKLDKSFIAGKCDDRRERLVVSRVIRMAKELGLTVVAEGVEETRQWTFLRECGCDLIQGNYASEPLTEDEFIDFFHCATGDI